MSTEQPVFDSTSTANDYIEWLEYKYGTISEECQLEVEKYASFLRQKEFTKLAGDIFEKRAERIRELGGQDSNVFMRCALFSAFLSQTVGEFKESMEKMEKISDIIEEKASDFYKSLFYSIMAFVKWHLAEKDEFEQFYEKAFESYCKIKSELDDVTPSSADCDFWDIMLSVLANSAKFAKNYDHASNVYTNLIYLSINSENLLLKLKATILLANVLSSQGFQDNSDALIEKSKKIGEIGVKTLHEIECQPFLLKWNALKICSYVNSLGKMYFFQKQLEKAAEVWQVGLKLASDNLGQNHPFVAYCSAMLAWISYDINKDPEKCNEYMSIVLRILDQVLENIDFFKQFVNEINISAKKVSKIFQDQRKWNKSVIYSKIGLELVESYYGENHQFAQELHYCIGYSYFRDNNFQDAKMHFKKSLDILKNDVATEGHSFDRECNGHICKLESWLLSCERRLTP